MKYDTFHNVALLFVKSGIVAVSTIDRSSTRDFVDYILINTMLLLMNLASNTTNIS
jgi:hypothetical protein